MGSAIAEFEDGLRLLFEGGRVLRREPSLWPLSVAPVLLSLIFVAVAGTLFFANLAAITAFCNSLLPVFEAPSGWSWLWVGPATFLVWIAGGLAVVVVFGVAIVAALLAANLVSAPFLERLSWRVERLSRAGRFEHGEDEIGAVRAATRSFFSELLRIGLLATIWIGLGFVGFVVPGAHLVTAPLLVAVTILFLPLEYAGHAFDRRGARFVDRLRFLRANRATMAGFGSVAFLACFVPGLNLLMMPALVIAGTLLVVRRDPVEDGMSDLATFSESEA